MVCGFCLTRALGGDVGGFMAASVSIRRLVANSDMFKRRLGSYVTLMPKFAKWVGASLRLGTSFLFALLGKAIDTSDTNPRRYEEPVGISINPQTWRVPISCAGTDSETPAKGGIATQSDRQGPW